MPLSLLLSCFQ